MTTNETLPNPFKGLKVSRLQASFQNKVSEIA